MRVVANVLQPDNGMDKTNRHTHARKQRPHDGDNSQIHFAFPVGGRRDFLYGSL
jgi:hypothetical protein